MKNQKVKRKKIDTDTIIIHGTIVRIFNKQVEVLAENNMITCLLPNSLMATKNSLVIGDQVEISLSGSGQFKLLNTLPRKTAFYRGNRRSLGEEILIAANAQMVFAIVTADYLLNQAGYLENAIIAAKRASLEVGLFISKWDTLNEQAQSLLANKLSFYQTVANHVFVGTPNNLNENLLQAVKGKTTVVVGDRASGKTTLIQSILSTLNEDEKSHTSISSTHTGVLRVGTDNTTFIDTPGFRDFALQQITEEEINFVFPEIDEYAKNCSFRNCTHTHEDNCGVIEAIRTNKIQRERFHAYQKMIGTVIITAPKIDYRHTACIESFACKVCGEQVIPEGAGTRHRNHCPHCLSSIHVDNEPGDRASLCDGIMDPVSVWVRKDGEWAIIHKCRLCGELSSNRIAADDNPMLLMSIAVKPLSRPPFPLNSLEQSIKR